MEPPLVAKSLDVVCLARWLHVQFNVLNVTFVQSEPSDAQK